MNLQKNFFKISVVALVVMTLFIAACGPTYVQQPVGQNGQQYYDPGYNPDNTIADAILAAAIINGVSGYYGPNHIFYPQMMYGGVPGYYVGGVFHTSTTYRTTIVNNYNHDRTLPAERRTVVVPGANKPAFGAQAGGMTRGPATTAPSNKPSFGSQPGGMTRGPASSSTPSNKPSFGSSPGGMTRSSPSRSTPSSSSSSSRSTRR